MEFYCGIDLHSTNSYVVVSDGQDRAVFQRRLANDLGVILKALAPFAERLCGVVVESTYNWYWLVDGLQEAGYRVHLANPAAIQQYEGLKYADDRSDAAWLARLLRLGVLPEGYIYPKAERGLRDLLRRRGQLVRQQTANLLAVQNQVTRSTGRSLSADRIKRLETGALLGHAAFDVHVHRALYGELGRYLEHFSRGTIVALGVRSDVGRSFVPQAREVTSASRPLLRHYSSRSQTAGKSLEAAP